MAANIATINGRDAMAYQGQTPWHKLGTRIQSSQSVEDVMRMASLNDWNLACHKLKTANGLDVPMTRAVVRQLDSTVLSTVGIDYHILSNEDAFRPFQPSIDKYGLTIESAGALGSGETVWMLAKMPNTIAPVEGDDINGYMLLKAAHDGTSAYLGMFTPIRVVCQNTLQAATATENGGLFKLRHTKSIIDRSKDMDKMIVQFIGAMQATNTTFAAMANHKLTPAQVAGFIDAAFPNPKPNQPVSDVLAERRATVANLTINGKGAKQFGMKDGLPTAWGTYNAIVEYLDHVRPAEAGTSGAKARANESALFGAGLAIKAASLKMARQLVAA